MLFKHQDKCLQKHPDFIYDEACLDLLNKLSESVIIKGQYTECHNCKFQELATLGPNETTSVLVNTKYPFQIQYELNNKTFCSFQKLLFEHYRYGWNITKDCSSVNIKEPADSAYLRLHILFSAILTAFIVLFCFGTAWYMVKWFYKNFTIFRRFQFWHSEIENDLGGQSSSTPLTIQRTPSVRKHPHRIKSLDVFRGFCLILMIFVNYGGGQYWIFQHSPWNGLTIGDLLFPWFMWLMGFSLSISLNSKLRRGVPRRQLVFELVRRCIIFIILGIMINSRHNLSTIANLRFPGVLQRIGIANMILGIFEIINTKRTEIENVSCLYDIIVAWPQLVFITISIIIHTCITFLVNVPDCGRGYLGPGGLDDGGLYANCTGGVAGLIDRAVFGNHILKYPVCKKIYETTVTYDPEGILGTLTALLTAYLGVHAGRILITYHNDKARVIRWVIWGLVTGLVGGALCEFTKNDGIIPLNKQLWSLSYALVTASIAFILQSVLYVLVDVTRKWGGRPLFYPGMNSIFIYVGHEIFKNTFPFAWSPSTETHGEYLFMNLWGTAVWVAVGIYLYKHNIFIVV